ncbi:DUF58 domain-containing protein [Heyndrickxia vini]|uniref:DUF58 domain-containing protein n=1 Tax=Heyndrickxia vini TaxID=1476025 RepID=A0ABX7DYE1_9BACI|nr:DUF58 domain-containing protein [Heyndrickxia vini]QQZ08128.1 DUF58 domain-containing protein [Heyndrickxia vini]
MRTFLFLLITIAFLFGESWMLFIVASIAVFLYLHNFYFRKLGEKFYFDNNKELTRLNVDTEGEWLLTFVNEGYPIVKGALSISFDDCIEPTTYPFIKNRSFIEVNIPFKAWTNEQVEVRIPFLAIKRGVSRIYRLEVKVHHLFGSGAVVLNYNEIIKKKKLVYPLRKFLHNIENKPVLLHGYQETSSSLFYDPMQPIGTREYVNGDSFQHINWKASARMQKLQTKVFPNNGARTWLFVLNISDGHSINRDLEELISFTAYLIEQAVKENIAFAFAINVRTHGDIPYFYLSEGEGKIQRQKAFEMLSMLSFHTFPLPHLFMLKDIEKKDMSFPIIIHVGESAIQTDRILLSFKRKNSTIFKLDTINGQGVMKEWKQYQIEKQA